MTKPNNIEKTGNLQHDMGKHKAILETVLRKTVPLKVKENP